LGLGLLYAYEKTSLKLRFFTIFFQDAGVGVLAGRSEESRSEEELAAAERIPQRRIPQRRGVGRSGEDPEEAAKNPAAKRSWPKGGSARQSRVFQNLMNRESKAGNIF
jgi:hypothetical protein